MLRILAFLVWWPDVNKSSFRSDFIAGLTGAIVVLPQAVAVAAIAGMPPEYGLYAGMVPAIIAALFGSARHLVSGPTTAASIVLFSSLSVYALPGSADYVTLALTLTLMVGVIELVLGLARMGALFLDLELAIFMGVILSLVLYLERDLERVPKQRIVTRVPDPRLPKRAFSSDPSLPQCPQLRFLRIDGSLFFGSVDHIEEAIFQIGSRGARTDSSGNCRQGDQLYRSGWRRRAGQGGKKRKARGGDM